MSRYLGPTLKRSRRLGYDLETKSGQRDWTSKCNSSKPPGLHGDKKVAGKHASVYGEHAAEKQKARFAFGLSEKQFRSYYREAARRKGATGENLLILLERRLDNVVYRMGYASTRAEARQLVNHGAVVVNGHKLDIPSAMIKEGDSVEIREKSKVQTRIQDAMAIASERGLPEWVSVDPKKLVGTFVRNPDRNEIFPDLNENLIVEFYSR